MADWAASGRRDTYRATLVDPVTLQDVEPLAIVPGESSITYGYYTDNGYSGSISTVEPLPRSSTRLVRVYHTVEVDGYSAEEPMATMFVDKAPVNALFGAEDSSLSCYSTMLRLTDDVLDSDYGMGAGNGIWGHIANMVRSRGGTILNPDGLGRNLSCSHVLEIGTKVSTAVNTMAGWIDSRVVPDGMGRLILEPYVEPAKKDVKFTFGSDNSVYKSGAKLDDGRDGVCNRAVVYWTSKERTMRSVAKLPSTSPYSYESIGRWITKVEKLTDEVSQSSLDAKAKSVLSENSAANQYIEIEHVQIPGLRVGDVVQYVNDRDFARPVSARCMVTEMAMRLGPGCWTKSKLKVVGAL